jgi:hypothetical protein
MSDTSAFGFGQFVPGFDFLQNLSKTAAQAAPAAGAVPGMASWVAPTLSIEEIDKRIQELKAVQFWLDQNATALKATIQAMEVQKMTLSTLQSMNVNMADLAKAFTAKPPTPAPTASPTAAPTSATATAAEEPAKPKTSIFSPKPAPEPEIESDEVPEDDEAASAEAGTKSSTQAGAGQDAKAASDKPAVDPMQWWGALTQQFQGIAAAAMKDVAGEAMKAAATAAAQTSAQKGAKAPAKPAGKSAAKTAAKTAVKPAVKAPSKSKTQPKSGAALKAASKSVAKSAGASSKTASPKKR